MPEYRSKTSTFGRNMAGARALWRATGVKDGDFGKPIIAVVNSITQFVPGHVHLHEFGQMVCREIERAGGIAKEFNTIAIDDGIAMGHGGMLYSLPSRDLSADSVEDGAAAIHAAAETPYDIVLMDLQMPGVNGFEATRAIRESAGPNAAVPIIAMTAHAMRGDRERCLAAGMNDYISKPVSPQSLAAVLDRWIPEAVTVLFDKATMMERLADDPDAAREVATSFLDDIPLRLTALTEALTADDAAGARRQAHSIKGASSDVGGDALHDVAAAMEHAAAAGDLDAVRAQMDTLTTQFRELRVVLRRELFD